MSFLRRLLVPILGGSIFFEIVGPLLPPFRGKTVADPMDIFRYSAGAAVAGVI